MTTPQGNAPNAGTPASAIDLTNNSSNSASTSAPAANKPKGKDFSRMASASAASTPVPTPVPAKDGPSSPTSRSSTPGKKGKDFSRLAGSAQAAAAAAAAVAAPSSATPPSSSTGPSQLAPAAAPVGRPKGKDLSRMGAMGTQQTISPPAAAPSASGMTAPNAGSVSLVSARTGKPKGKDLSAMTHRPSSQPGAIATQPVQQPPPAAPIPTAAPSPKSTSDRQNAARIAAGYVPGSNNVASPAPGVAQPAPPGPSLRGGILGNIPPGVNGPTGAHHPNQNMGVNDSEASRHEAARRAALGPAYEAHSVPSGSNSTNAIATRPPSSMAAAQAIPQQNQAPATQQYPNVNMGMKTTQQQQAAIPASKGGGSAGMNAKTQQSAKKLASKTTPTAIVPAPASSSTKAEKKKKQKTSTPTWSEARLSMASSKMDSLRREAAGILSQPNRKSDGSSGTKDYGDPSIAPVLGQKLQDLCHSIDPSYTLDAEVQDRLVDLADSFLDKVVNMATTLAKHRGSNCLDVVDVALALKKGYNMEVPGLGPPSVARVNPGAGSAAKANQMGGWLFANMVKVSEPKNEVFTGSDAAAAKRRGSVKAQQEPAKKRRKSSASATAAAMM
mmetsp:Transcript_1789/g.3456  ORF Transcript_1789/g.3456 Transcript_1789/m.3456 type:complete len:613 (-) Transcript_1789:61-1899(-)